MLSRGGNARSTASSKMVSSSSPDATSCPYRHGPSMAISEAVGRGIVSSSGAGLCLLCPDLLFVFNAFSRGQFMFRSFRVDGLVLLPSRDIEPVPPCAFCRLRGCQRQSEVFFFGKVLSARVLSAFVFRVTLK
eukprot:scaffold1318_cov388-Prasinococcus_capsulatus_cf.AAC.29